jgi:hypothetical protein
MSARCSIYDGQDNPGGILGLADVAGRIALRFPRGSVPDAPPTGNIDGGDIAITYEQFKNVNPAVKGKGYTWFGGEHLTVFNVAFCDGSTRAISKDADMALVEDLVTRNGEEKTSVDDL